MAQTWKPQKQKINDALAKYGISPAQFWKQRTKKKHTIDDVFMEYQTRGLHCIINHYIHFYDTEEGHDWWKGRYNRMYFDWITHGQPLQPGKLYNIKDTDLIVRYYNTDNVGIIVELINIDPSWEREAYTVGYHIAAWDIPRSQSRENMFCINKPTQFILFNE